MKSYDNLTKYEKRFSWTARFGPLYRMYLGKLWTILIKDKKTWIFEALMLLPVIAGPLVALTAQEGLDYDNYFATFSDIMFMGYIGLIIPLFTMYIASSLFSEEINDRTITYLTARPIHRFELIITKYLSYLTIVPFFTIIGSGVVYLSFAVFGRFQYLKTGLWFTLVAVVASVVYGAFFMFIGLLFKNPLWIGLFFVFIWEFILASFSATMNKLTIAYYLKSLIVKGPTIIKQNQAYEFNFFYGGGAATWRLILILVMIVVVSLTLGWSKLQGDTFKIPYQAGRRPGGWKYYLKEIRSFLITIGITFIAIGAVIGPVSGLKESKSYHTSQQLDFHPYLMFQGEGSIYNVPYAKPLSFSLAKGDAVNVSLVVSEVSHITYEIYTVVCTESDFEDLVTEVNGFLSIYEREYFEEEADQDILYQILVANYSQVASAFVTVAPQSVRLFPSISRQINLQADRRADEYIVTIVTNFNVYEEEIFEAEISEVISSETFRKAGFIFGFVILSIGLIAIGIASYSLLTYSSADEIRQYEEKISQYEDRGIFEEVSPSSKAQAVSSTSSQDDLEYSSTSESIDK